MAPNDYRDQDNFIKTLSECIISKTNTSRVIIAGDWNLSWIELINKVVNHGKQQLIETLFLTLWMNLSYWHISTITPKNQILYLRVKNLKVKIKNWFFPCVSPDIFWCFKIRTSIASDHKSVFLSVEIKSEIKRGPGLWKFNNTLLEDENYKELFMFYYPQIVGKHSEVTDNYYGN